MAIIKLGEICNIKIGKTPLTSNKEFWENGTIGWITGSDFTSNIFLPKKITLKAVKQNKQILTTGKEVLLSIVRYITPIIVEANFSFNQGVAQILPKESIIKQKYLYYWLVLKKEYIRKNETIGATFPSINTNIIKRQIINLPLLKEQQKIIDIIEPLEKLKNNLNKQLELFSKYSEFIMTEYNILEKMNKRCQFLKGESITNFSEGQTLFLNVAAANGNPNKYCYNIPNIFPKDITLSLDGNTGLVNNNLLGFNGYLYKVKSEVIPNWQIYYSLKNKINQKIIKLNEIGTTIKHSSNSKKQLLLLDFKQKNVLEKIFYFEINLKNQINLIEKQIKKIISILIK